MKTIALLTMCLAGGLVLAEDNEQDDASGIEKIQVRLAYLEQIDVTAEKEFAESDEPLDTEIEKILQEVEALETSAAEQ